MSRVFIAIEGASGAGKTAIATDLAYRLAYPYFGCGFFYRSVAFAAQSQHISSHNEHRLLDLISALDLRFEVIQLEEDVIRPQIILSGDNITQFILTENIAYFATQMTSIPTVNQAILSWLTNEIKSYPNSIIEGRGIVDSLFPDTRFKFFLMASLEVRAFRRHQETGETLSSILILQ